MKLPKLQQLSEAADGNTVPLLEVLEKAQAKLDGIDRAMDEVVALTSKLPGLFSKNIHSGNVHNLDNPKEYPIAISIENIKSLYSLSKEFRETQRAFEQLKKQLKGYKK